MVIGNGLIARRFHLYDSKPVIIFASGISNSQLKDSTAIERERKLVRATLADNPGLPFVYFSTYSVDDPVLNKSEYVIHKAQMEQYIQAHAAEYYIIRTSNIVGESHANKHTIVNFLHERIMNDIPFELWSGAYRNILDIDHLYQIVDNIISLRLSNQVCYVVNPVSFPMTEIVEAMEKTVGRAARYNLIEKGERFDCDTSLSAEYFYKFQISLENYLTTVLRKYYSPVNAR
jgi:dTDP-4-dehydrorhamnose reductase